MNNQILVMRVKKRKKTDECIQDAQRIESHLNNGYKVLIIDKNVESIELFELPTVIKAAETDFVNVIEKTDSEENEENIKEGEKE